MNSRRPPCNAKVPSRPRKLKSLASKPLMLSYCSRSMPGPPNASVAPLPCTCREKACASTANDSDAKVRVWSNSVSNRAAVPLNSRPSPLSGTRSASQLAASLDSADRPRPVQRSSAASAAGPGTSGRPAANSMQIATLARWLRWLTRLPCVLRTTGFALGTARRLTQLPCVLRTTGFALGTARRLTGVTCGGWVNGCRRGAPPSAAVHSARPSRRRWCRHPADRASRPMPLPRPLARVGPGCPGWGWPNCV